VIIVKFDNNFNLNAGDPSLSLRMTGHYGSKREKKWRFAEDFGTVQV